ncbi:MAG: hypothetical protein RL685_7691, partial [Pseudomonadota bacterium]
MPLVVPASVGRVLSTIEQPFDSAAGLASAAAGAAATSS